MKYLKSFKTINEDDNSLFLSNASGGFDETKDGRYTDPDLEKQRLGKFDIKKAFVEQIPELVDEKDGEKIIGVTFDTKTTPQIARAFTVDDKAVFGMITYEFVDGKIKPMISNLVQSLDEIKDNIKKFT